MSKRKPKPAKRRKKAGHSLPPIVAIDAMIARERASHVSRWRCEWGAYRYRPNLMVFHLLPIIALDVVQESYGWSLTVGVSFLHGHAYAQAGKW